MSPVHPTTSSCLENDVKSSEDEQNINAINKIDKSTNLINLPLSLHIDCNLTELTLMRCDLLEFSPSIIHLNSLVNINLSHNKLNSLPPQFNALNKVRTLNLSHNEFSEAPLCLFKGMRLLKELDLSHNKLTKFDLAPLCITLVQIIKLNNNLIECIPLWFFQEVTACLSEVDLSDNLSAAPEVEIYNSLNRITSVSHSVQAMNLSKCCLNEKNISFISHFSNLRSLDLSNYNVNTKTCRNQNSFQRIPVGFLKCLETLEELRIKNVCLPLIEDEISKLINLRVLDISMNCVNWLPVSICKLQMLEKLVLSKCGLYFLPPELCILSKLKGLYLDENELMSVPETFMDLINLEVLDLYHNNLNICPDFNSFKMLKALDVSMNFLDVPAFFKINDQSKSYKEMRNALLSDYVPDTNRTDERRFIAPESSQLSDSDSRSSDIDFISENDLDCLEIPPIKHCYGNCCISEDNKEGKDSDEEEFNWDCGLNSDNYFVPNDTVSYSRSWSDESLNVPMHVRENKNFFKPYEKQFQFYGTHKRFTEFEEGQFDDV